MMMYDSSGSQVHRTSAEVYCMFLLIIINIGACSSDVKKNSTLENCLLWRQISAACSHIPF